MIRKATLAERASALVYDMRQRINPAYADQRGTESYERRECCEMIECLLADLQAAIAEAEKAEPVAWRIWSPDGTNVYQYTEDGDGQPLYTHPAQAEPKGLFIDMIAQHPGLAEELSKPPYDIPPEPLSDERILEIAHRKATKYAHRSDPTYHSYAFVPHTLIDFVRAIEAEVAQTEIRTMIEGAWLQGYYRAGYTNDSAYAFQEAAKCADEFLGEVRDASS